MTTHCPPVSRRALLAAALAGPWIGAGAQVAVPAEVSAELPGARLLGQGRLTYFGLHIYDARLWVADGFAADSFALRPLALELEYARALVGKLIAERSLDEMKRAGGFADDRGHRWLTAMTQTFPDVTKGDRLTGLHRPGEAASFFLNGKPRGEVRDAEFARRFFGIWLSPQTSEPKLRAALLGPNRAGS
jgi:Chalcone isomerase-like